MTAPKRQARGGKKADAPAAPVDKEPQPWANFQEAPLNPALEASEKARRAPETELVPADGCSHYLCRQDCGSGKYRKGTIYALRDDFAKARPMHFEKR